MGISHENIRGIINQKVSLREIIDRQVQVLEGQIIDLEKFKMDSVSFLYLWGGSLAWGIITGLCFVAALLMYPHLPMQLPIQWSDGEISSEVGKIFILHTQLDVSLLDFFYVRSYGGGLKLMLPTVTLLVII